MFLTKSQRFSSSHISPSTRTSIERRRTIGPFKNSFSMGSAATSSLVSRTTPKTSSIVSDFTTLDENDYEATRQIMRNLIEEIRIEKPFISFSDIFLDQDDIIGCLLRIFDKYAENINGIKQITRERMITLLDSCEIFNGTYTELIFINDWNNMRKKMIKKKIYERKSKAFDFSNFVQLIDIIKNHLYTSKDEILKKIIGVQIYKDVIKLKEVRHKIKLGLLPTMSTLIEQYNEVNV